MEKMETVVIGYSTGIRVLPNIGVVWGQWERKWKLL